MKKEQQVIEINTATLPLSSAVRTGLEPATPCVTGMYSNQLNYRTKDICIYIGKLSFPFAIAKLLLFFETAK